MKIKIKGILIAWIILIQLPDTSAMDGREIMEKSREVSRIPGLEAVSTLKIIDSRGRERTRQISMASKSYQKTGTEKRIIRFLSPPSVMGTGMLIYDYDEKNDDMWIYMPALRKTRRIVSTEKSQSFMGTEFSNADMSAPSLDDFHYNLVGQDPVNGTACWKIEIIPAGEEVINEMGFHRKIAWIGQEDYVLRKAEYYEEDMEPMKILTASQIKKMDPDTEKYMATRMEVENLQNGRKSLMTIDRFQFNPDVKDEYFTVAYLENF